MPVGTAIIDFGAWPGSNEASVLVPWDAAMFGTTKTEAFVMSGSSTLDHSVSDHQYLPVFTGFTCSIPVSDVGFYIYGRSSEQLTGTFELNWVCA